MWHQIYPSVVHNVNKEVDIPMLLGKAPYLVLGKWKHSQKGRKELVLPMSLIWDLKESHGEQKI